jgi:hypothetical protein
LFFPRLRTFIFSPTVSKHKFTQAEKKFFSKAPRPVKGHSGQKDTKTSLSAKPFARSIQPVIAKFSSLHFQFLNRCAVFDIQRSDPYAFLFAISQTGFFKPAGLSPERGRRRQTPHFSATHMFQTLSAISVVRYQQGGR